MDQFFSEEGGKGVVFQMVKAQDVIEKYQHPGYLVVKPVFPQEEEEDKEKRDTDEEEPEQQETASQKGRRLINEFYDQDLEDKVTSIPNKDDDLEALIIHWASTVSLVKEIFVKSGNKHEALANNSEPENLKKLLLAFEEFVNSQLKENSVETSVRCEVGAY